MIITSSRASTAECWRKVLNTYHRNLQGMKSMALIDGGAEHVILAYGLATRDWETAVDKGLTQFALEVGDQNQIAVEDREAINDHKELLIAMAATFKQGFEKEPYEIIQPECTFKVPLPDSDHHCIWLHWVDLDTGEEVWGTPPPEKILARKVASPHEPYRGVDMNCPCYGPHYVAGTTDAIVLWDRFLWLMDHKTTSMMGEVFWAQWELDLQLSIYLYGIWKSLNIKPRGIIVNALRKPTSKQVSSWNQRRRTGPDKSIGEYLGYERRAFLRTDEDLLRVEPNLIELCHEWEWRILTGRFRPVLQRSICVSYGKRCVFHTACNCHEEPGSFAGLWPRNQRYDDQLIQLALNEAKEKAHNEESANT